MRLQPNPLSARDFSARILGSFHTHQYSINKRNILSTNRKVSGKCGIQGKTFNNQRLGRYEQTLIARYFNLSP